MTRIVATYPVFHEFTDVVTEQTPLGVMDGVIGVGPSFSRDDLSYLDKATILQGNFADDDRTLIALALNGEPLAIDHGYPARLIAPNRPGVLQTKWVHRLEVAT